MAAPTRGVADVFHIGLGIEVWRFKDSIGVTLG
jgi:hypothetical protein